MNLAEEFREEGRIEGRDEGKAEVARNLLRMGSDPALVRTVTGFSDEQLKQLGLDKTSA